MNIFFVGVLAFALGSVANAQDPETTPFPAALTSFTCHGRAPGYYADLETGCKTYHVCDGNSHFTYLCPKRTLFQQRSRICDHSYLVRCQDSPYFYETDDDDDDDDDFEETFNRLQEPTKGTDQNQTEESVTTTNAPTAKTPTTVFTTPTSTQTIKVEQTTVILKKQERPTESFEKFVKFRLKDFRSLFFIPEFYNNSVVAKTEREFLLPVEENDLMTFRNRKEVPRLSSLCPSYCDPKFFVPGTCHPCIMIK